MDDYTVTAAEAAAEVGVTRATIDTRPRRHTWTLTELMEPAV